MLSAGTTLKVMQWYGTLLFIGMTTFPDIFLAAYKFDFNSAPARGKAPCFSATKTTM